MGEGKSTETFVGMFPKSNDTITIYKVNDTKTDVAEEFCFWSKKKINSNTITFYNLASDTVRVIFKKQNEIIMDQEQNLGIKQIT